MSATVQAALIAATGELREAGIDNAAGDARRLLAHALSVEPDRLTLILHDPVDQATLTRLDGLLSDRRARKPVSHILGSREFWGRQFKVTPDVLDPRPETETLIETALAQPFNKVLDLGTGSGCILLTLLSERANATGMGVDISAEALEIAAHNRAELDLVRRAIFAHSDWYGKVVGQFDLIVANPPYIAMPEMAGLAPEVLRWEPMAALTPGLSGLEAYEVIAAGITPHLTPQGRVLMEIGPTQGQAVSALFQNVGLDLISVHPDMDGRDRVVEMRNPG